MKLAISSPSCASLPTPEAPRAGLVGQTLLLRFWAAVWEPPCANSCDGLAGAGVAEGLQEEGGDFSGAFPD